MFVRDLTILLWNNADSNLGFAVLFALAFLVLYALVRKSK